MHISFFVCKKEGIIERKMHLYVLQLVFFAKFAVLLIYNTLLAYEIYYNEVFIGDSAVVIVGIIVRRII